MNTWRKHRTVLELHDRLGFILSPQAARFGAVALALLGNVSPVGAESNAHTYSPETAEHLSRGQNLVNSGRYDEARAEVTAILKDDPKCIDAFEVIGVSYLKQGDCVKAEEALQKAFELAPDDSNILNNLGNAEYRQGKLNQSIDVYKKALALPNSEPHKIWVNLGNSYGDLGRLDDAIGAFNRALQLKQGFAPAYLGLGRMYMDHNKHFDAERELRAAIKYKPDYSSAYYYLGRVLNERGRYTEALSTLQKSRLLEKNAQYSSETNELIGQIEARLAGHKVATVSSQPMPAASLDSKDLCLERVNHLLMQRDWVAAQKVLEQICAKYDKDDPVVWNNLGYAKVHQGAKTNTKPYSLAIDDYKTAIKLKHGPFPTAQYNLGEAYRLLELGQYSRAAQDAFQQAIRDAQSLHTTCPLAQNGLGLMLKQHGDVKGADAAYRRAISQAGSELPVAHYNLGLLLEQSGRTREAVTHYNAYLAAEPHGFNADKVRLRLSRLVGSEPHSGT